MVLRAFDTNILIYALGIIFNEDDKEKEQVSRNLIEKIIASGDTLVLPLQALAETHFFLVRKGG